MTLVALIAVTTGAWAESKPIGLNVEYEVGDEITSTTDVYVYYGEQPSTSKQMVVKITSTHPLKIFMIDAHGFELNGDAAVYYMPDGNATGGYAGAIPCVGESTGDATVVHVASGSGTLTDPYVFGSGPSGTPVPITWDATAKTATIAAMPAGNVTVKVKYFAQAEFAKSIGETPELLAPTAINDVPATTDGAIVKAGTVANIGETETAQGTVMYYAVQSATAPTAPDYDATGWTDKVPTATDFAEGNVYVWYYIKGAEPASGTDRTDANTCSDSEITALGTTGYVTIAAAPTYAITLKEGTEDVGKWTISPAEATKGTTITATYSGTKRVKSVKAVKKAAGKVVDLSTYTGDSYEVTENVTFTGSTNNEISILYKGDDDYEVTLDNVNAPKCFIAAKDDWCNINVKLKGTSRLMGIYTRADIIIGEAAAGGTVILVDENTPLGASGATITINGGTVKAKTSYYSALYDMLKVNGGAVYLEAGDGYSAVSISAEGSVTLYGWNGSAWVTYSQEQDHRYLSTDNSKAPSQWTW